MYLIIESTVNGNLSSYLLAVDCSCHGYNIPLAFAVYIGTGPRITGMECPFVRPSRDIVLWCFEHNSAKASEATLQLGEASKLSRVNISFAFHHSLYLANRYVYLSPVLDLDGQAGTFGRQKYRSQCRRIMIFIPLEYFKYFATLR